MKIFAMSKSKKEVLSNLENLDMQVLTHLACLWIFPNAQEVKHWRDEVYTFYASIPKTKPRNKYPTADEIYSKIYLGRSNAISNLFGIAEAKETYLLPDQDRLNNFTEFQDNLEQYLWWVSESLSNDGVVNPHIARNLMKELGF